MNCKAALITALFLPFLTACGGRAEALSAVPFVSPSTLSSTPSALFVSRTNQETLKAGVWTDQLPSDLTEEFLSWIWETYGAVVMDCLKASLEEGTYKSSLWHQWTGSHGVLIDLEGTFTELREEGVSQQPISALKYPPLFC